MSERVEHRKELQKRALQGLVLSLLHRGAVTGLSPEEVAYLRHGLQALDWLPHNVNPLKHLELTEELLQRYLSEDGGAKTGPRESAASGAPVAGIDQG